MDSTTGEQQASDPATSQDRLRELAEESPELAVIVAHNPAAGADLLVWIAGTSPTLEAEAAIARHPNTPAGILWRLVDRHPYALADNPALPLMPLEHPNFFRTGYHSGAFKAMLRIAGLPALVVEALERNEDPSVAQAARLHIAVAGEAEAFRTAELNDELAVLRFKFTGALLPLIRMGLAPGWIYPRLLGDERSDVRAAAAASPAAPARLIELLRRASGSEDLREMNSPSMDLSPDELEEIASAGLWARLLAARHPNTSLKTLERLAAIGGERIQAAVASHPACSEELLERLAHHAGGIRALAGRHPKSPGELLSALAKSRAPRERMVAAAHPGTPTEVLARLAEDPVAAVRREVASNRGAPKEIRARLEKELAAPAEPQSDAADPSNVRRGRGRRKRSTTDLTPIDWEARLQQNRLKDVLKLASDPRSPGWVLGQLLKHRLRPVRNQAARNPAAPTDGVMQLAARDPGILSEITHRPDLPPQRLRELATSRMGGERLRAWRHPNTPEDVREGLRAEGLRECLQSRSLLSRVIALGHPTAEAADLEQGFDSPEWLERLAIALNPSAPLSALQALALDGNRLVRAAAQDALGSHPDRDS